MDPRKKKLIQAKLIVLVTVLMLISSVPVYADKNFKDVSSRYTEAVEFLTANELAAGLSATEFGTAAKIKRGDAAVILANALGIKGEGGQPSTFRDVPYRAAAAVNGLQAAGIAKGKNTVAFGFEDPLKRGEIALMLAGAAAYNLNGNPENVAFKDVNDRYIKAVAGLVEHGITAGKTAEHFGADDPITRGEFAIFIFKAEQLKKEQKELAEMPDLTKLISLAQDRDQIRYGLNVELELAELAENLDYTADWSASGGKLTVASDGKSAVWEPVLNRDGTYVISVRIDSALPSGKVISFMKETSVAVTKREKIQRPAPVAQPYQALISFDQTTYLSGDEVTVTGVLHDQDGQALTGYEVSLEDSQAVTDENGAFTLSFLAIEEERVYQLYSGNTLLQVQVGDGQLSDSFQVALETDQVDFQPGVTGLSSDTVESMIEFVHGEKAVFEGAPEHITNLTAGDIFVTAATEEFPLGTFGKVTSVEAGTDQTVVWISEPELTEVFAQLEVEGTQALKVENITPGDGIEVYATSDVPSGEVRVASSAVIGEDIHFSLEKDWLDVEEGWTYRGDKLEADIIGEVEVGTTGKIDLQNTKIAYDLSLLEGGGELTFYNEQVISLGIVSKVNGSGEVRLELGDIFIPVYGPVGVTGSLWAVVGVNGEITFDISYSQTSELELGVKAYGGDVDGSGRFDVVNRGFSAKAEGKATAKIGFKPNVFISVYSEELVGFDNEFGLSSDITATIEHVGTEDERACKVTEEKLYVSLNAQVDDWEDLTFELFKRDFPFGKTDTCPVPQQLSVSPADDYVKKGQVFQLEVRGTTEDGEDRDYAPKTEGTSYVSSDPETAAVSKDGLVTVSPAAQVGSEFTVTVTNSGKEAVAAFKVIEIERIELTPQEIKLPAGGKQLLAVDAILTNGEKLRMNDEKLPVSFSVDNEDLAGVTSSGNVIVNESSLIGTTTTVTAAYKEFEETATIEVIRAPGEDAEAELSIIPLPAAAAGYQHSVHVRDDGTVWTWGSNKNGQLGTGDTADSLVPQQVAGLPKITAVAAGKEHTLALAEDKTVWAWGTNSDGQLGTGTNDNSLTPVQVTGLENVLSIAAGSRTSYAIMTDGTVKAWGSGRNGLLGNGSEADSNFPVDVADLAGIVSIDSASSYSDEGHVIALRKDGTVWTWGNGYFGALGNGPHLSTVWNDDATTPVQVAGLHAEGLLTDIVRVQAGDTHSLALGSDGSVYGWGSGWGSELFDSVNHPVQKRNADGSLLQGVTEIAAGSYQDNNILKADGTIWTWQSNQAPTQLQNLDGVVHIATGGYHSFALKEDGSVWAWGWNDYGQLGDGTTKWVQSGYTKVQ